MIHNRSNGRWTQANGDAVLGEQGPVVMAGVVAALVGVMQQITPRLTVRS